MSLRWQFERSGRFFVDYKVEIYDSEYSGSPMTLENVGGQPLEMEMGRMNADHLDNVRGTSSTIRLFAGSGDFDDLFTRDIERFRIEITIDGNTYYHVPVPDTFTDYVTDGKFTNEIKAADLSILKQFRVMDILDEDVRMSKLDGIYQIINHLFDYNVVDGTIEYPSGSNENTSALSQIDFNTERFEDETAYEALQWLSGEIHQIRVSRGKVFVFPALEASFEGYEYDGNSVSSGVSYDDNFTAIFKGGRLGTRRTKMPVFDGVERVYQPLQAPNLVPGGDFADLDDFNYAEGGFFGLRVGLPVGWEVVSGGLWQIKNTGIDASPYMAQIPIGNGVWEANTEKVVIEGQHLRLSMNVEFNSSRNVLWAQPIQVRVGDYVLQTDHGVEGSRITGEGELSWVHINDTNQPYALILEQSGNTRNYSEITPPLPETGEVYFRMTAPVSALLILTGFPQSVGPNDSSSVFGISLDAVDEEGDIIESSDSFAGSRGDVYSYIERFGDGFTSLNPGALFFDGTPTSEWSLKGLSGTGSLAELQPAYMLSELIRDRDRWQGTADVFDTIALIEGKRVNYIKTDFRFGNSTIELVEIADHDIEATPEERRQKGVDGPPIGDRFVFPQDLFPFSRQDAIGEITRDYIHEETEDVDMLLSVPVKAGLEYWVVNESEVSASDREDGIYALIVQTTDENGDPIDPNDEGYDDGIKEYGPGNINVPIQEQIINAPNGSLIFKASGQDEASIQFFEEVTIGVQREKVFDSIATLAQDIGADGLPDNTARTSLSLKDIDENIDLFDQQRLQVVSQRGLSDFVIVDGDQTLTPDTHTLAIESKVFSHFYRQGFAWLREAGYKLSSRLNLTVEATDNNFTSIAALETHTNIGGGEAFSALTLKSEIETNEDGIATNVSSIATLENHVNLSGGSSFSSLTLKNEIGDNVSAIADLNASVSILEDDSNVVIRSFTEPTTRPSGEALQAGDIWVDPSTFDPNADPPTEHTTYQWDGSEWIEYNGVLRLNTAGLMVDVNEYRSRALLYAKTGGGIAFIDLDSNETEGTNITISADMVSINNWEFEDANGILRSTTQVNGNDAIILDGTTGVGTFENVSIRGGSITGTDISGNVGAIRVVSSLPGSGDYVGQVVYLTSDPNNLYRWNGSSWISTVDGANLIANSVTAGAINVANLSAINANTGNLSISGTLSMGSSGSISLPGSGGMDQNGIILDASNQSFLFGPLSALSAGLKVEASQVQLFGDVDVGIVVQGSENVAFLENKQNNAKISVTSLGNTIFDNPDGDIILNSLPTFDAGQNRVYVKQVGNVSSSELVLCLGQ
jgi:hypothetical protein